MTIIDVAAPAVAAGDDGDDDDGDVFGEFRGCLLRLSG